MAYAPTEWKDGDLITKERMNKLEQGVRDASGSGGGADGLPSGVVVMWSGDRVEIPAGWALCDGENGTPDLRDRFVVGAGKSYNVNAAGGEAEHKLTIGELAQHSHNFLTYYEGPFSKDPSGNIYPLTTLLGGPEVNESTLSAGENEPHNNLPPYYALCYIMKI